MSKAIRHINPENPEVANAVLMLLCNLTREKNNANKVYDALVDQIKVLESFIKLFCTGDIKHGTCYDYVSYLLSNLCQLHEVRM